MYQLYGHKNSGAAAIEAALELCQIAYRFIDTEASAEADEALGKLNPLKQIPTLQLPDGSAMIYVSYNEKSPERWICTACTTAR